MNQMGAHGIGIGQMMNHNQGQSHFNPMNQAMMNQPPVISPEWKYLTDFRDK